MGRGGLLLDTVDSLAETDGHEPACADSAERVLTRLAGTQEEREPVATAQLQARRRAEVERDPPVRRRRSLGVTRHHLSERNAFHEDECAHYRMVSAVGDMEAREQASVPAQPVRLE